MKDSTYSILGSGSSIISGQSAVSQLHVGEVAVDVYLPELKELIEKFQYPPQIHVEVPSIKLPTPVINFQAPDIVFPEIKLPPPADVHVSVPETTVQVQVNPTIATSLTIDNKKLLWSLVIGVYFLITLLIAILIRPVLLQP